MNFPLPELGEGVYEAELVRWLIKPGDTVKRGQGLLEAMTDKATMEVPAAFAGVITALNAGQGDKIKVGQPILEYTPIGASDSSSGGIQERKTEQLAVATSDNGSASTAVMNQPKSAPAHVPAAPSVRHLARKLGIDLEQIKGSGPGGRILHEDVAEYLAKSLAAAQAASSGNDKPKKPSEPKPDYGTPGTRIKLQGLRRKIAEHLVDSKRRIPHYSYIDEIEITELVRLRKSLREPAAERGIKLTYLPFFVKAVVLALKEIPLVASTLNEETQEIILHNRYNIGIAVATPNGLIVPVIKEADKKDIFAIAADIDRLGVDAKTNKSRLDDLKGGVFTITSIGNIGGLISTPIVNHPETGIMGIGKVVRRPVFVSEEDDERIRAADMVYLSFSFDHRVLDGAVGAAFGNAVARELQRPAAMLLPRLS